MSVIIIDANLFDLKIPVFIEDEQKAVRRFEIEHSQVCDFALELAENNNINKIYIAGAPSYAENIKNEIMETSLKEYKNIDVEVIA